MKTEVTKKENAEVVISVVLPNKDIQVYRDDVEAALIKKVKVDGFREGNVPKDVAMKQISEMQIVEEMAQRAISAKYVEILEKEDIKAIGHPQISITKIAPDQDLEFTITTAVMPEVSLGDYTKIAKEAMNEEYSEDVEEKELEEAINNLRRMRAQQELSKDQKEGEEPVSWSDIKDEDLPELTDEWVKELGSFENVEDFKSKMKENLQKEKAAKNTEKRRIAILDGILEDSTIEVPAIMVDYETDKMMHEFEGNIAMTGMSFDDYLKSIGKTREDYKKEWREQAVKRAKTQVMLNEIAAQEKIEADDKEVDEEVAKIMEQYKGQQGVDENNARAYVATVLTHQKVFEFLEKQ